MNIKHDTEKKRFYAEVKGKEAELTYKIESADILNYNSTFTPPELRGQGIAGQITKAALDYAKANDKKVKPGCPYVREYITRHPQYQSLLAL